MLSPNFFTQVVEDSPAYGKFVIEPLPLSFGQSMGNVLRRVLLSSLKGAAVTSVKIDGAPHMFTTVKGVKESVLEVILNLKQLRFEKGGAASFSLTLSSSGAGKIYAKDIESEQKIVNENLYIAEITDAKGKLEFEAVAETGIGYSPAEEREKTASGYIAVDAFFSPVTKVNFQVEEARAGRKSNLERLILEIGTDGSISPKEALKQSSLLIGEYFSYVLSGKDVPQITEAADVARKEQDEIDKKLYEVIIDELNLPSRVINALLRENIETVADLIKAGREKLTNMKGVGKKSIELIEEELRKMGITLS
ncbi:DNA-directed RNA polymerase subunit alpha [Candidatus Roizmanbacteria bacterium]|nr:DNA-directed RNA polymerase subunit alpha [Candidatus Roizmanbacteria bacterium]